MTTQTLRFNAFAHLVSPADILDAVRQSAALETLRSNVYRPLDKPFLSSIRRLVEIDAEIDALPDEVFEDDFDTQFDGDLDGEVFTASTPVRWG